MKSSKSLGELEQEYIDFLRELNYDIPSHTPPDLPTAVQRLKAAASRSRNQSMSVAFDRLEKDHPELSQMVHAAATQGLREPLEIHNAVIGRAIKRLARTRLPPTLVRECPTGDVNASIQVLKSGVLLLVNSGLPRFIHQVGKVVAYASPEFVKFPGGPHASQRDASSGLSEEGLLYACGMALGVQLFGYVRYWDPSGLSPLPPPALSKYYIVMDLLTAAERFVIAHEYGHLVCGHLVRAQAKMALPNGATIALPLREHQNEFEADRFALHALLSEGMECYDVTGMEVEPVPTRSKYLSNAIAGVWLFMAVAELREELHPLRAIVDGATSGTPAAHTHPPAAERRKILLQIAKSQAGRKRLWFAEALTAFLERIRPLAIATAATLLKQHGPGVPPTEILKQSFPESPEILAAAERVWSSMHPQAAKKR